MISEHTPANGDFASVLQQKNPSTSRPSTGQLDSSSGVDPVGTQSRQTIDDVVVYGEEPTEDFLNEWNELHNLPELSDEELARQALNAPGDDGDINTPE